MDILGMIPIVREILYPIEVKREVNYNTGKQIVADRAYIKTVREGNSLVPKTILMNKPGRWEAIPNDMIDLQKSFFSKKLVWCYDDGDHVIWCRRTKTVDDKNNDIHFVGFSTDEVQKGADYMYRLSEARKVKALDKPWTDKWMSVIIIACVAVAMVICVAGFMGWMETNLPGVIMNGISEAIRQSGSFGNQMGSNLNQTIPPII